MTAPRSRQVPSVIAPGTVLAVFQSTIEPSAPMEQHEHFRHQLSWSPKGVLHVASNGRHWILPPSLGSWIPGGVEHAVGAHRTAALHSVWFHPPLCDHLLRPGLERPCVIAVTDLVRALIGHLADDALDGPERRRAEYVLVDQLRPLAASSVALPLPNDPRALAIAEGIMAEPADDRTVAEWGRSVGASSRTLVRLFPAQTGLTFTAWRTQARLLAALAHLADGATVTATSHLVGYRDRCSFITAFTRHFGTTPAQHAAVGAATRGSRR